MTTIAAITCAITKNWGVDGLLLAIEIFVIFFPAIEFVYYFWINLRSENSDGKDRSEG